MAAENGNINKILLVLVSILTGVVVTGMSMVVRGDMLGKKAADQAEARVNERMDRELNYIHQTLIRIENKLDEDPQ